MKTYSVRNLSDLTNAIESVHRDFDGQPWWRGQTSDWSLKPGVFRVERSDFYEANIARKFMKRAYTRHDDCPDRDQLASWLFLMQHYRLPTRLLDWTEAALTGLYFAVRKEGKDEDKDNGVLWALDPFAMNQQLTGEWGIQDPGYNEAKQLVAAAFEEATAPAQYECVGLMSEVIDIRMMVQQSGFTIHGSDTPMDQLYGTNKYLQKLEIDSNAKQGLLRWAKRLGVRERALFPDLEHLARDLQQDRYGRPGKFRHPRQGIYPST